MSYKWPGIPNGDYSFDHGRAVWNRIISYLRRLSEKLDADIVDATADRRGMMTAEDKAAFDAIPETYETQEHAAATYETQDHAAATYETQDHAADTYETKTHASVTYAVKYGSLTDDPIIRTSQSGREANIVNIGSDLTNPDTSETFDLGWNYVNRDGALLGLRSSSYSTEPGYFKLYARDENKQSILQGTPNGELTWRDNQVITLVDTATTTKNGVMTAADKTKLDNIENNYVLKTGDTMTGMLVVPAIRSQSSGNVQTKATGGYTGLVIKDASASADSTPNNGMVIEVYKNNANYAGQLFLGDNASQGLYWNGWNSGTYGVWKKFIMTSDNTYTVGSTTKPVYVNNGAVAACTYELNASVPANAKFTDTVTTVSTSGSGNAVTSITASNGALTVKKDSTFSLSNHTHSSVSWPRVPANGYVDVVSLYDADATSNRAGTIRIENGAGFHVISIGAHNEANQYAEGLAIKNTNGTVTSTLSGSLTAGDFIKSTPTTSYVKKFYDGTMIYAQFWWPLNQSYSSGGSFEIVYPEAFKKVQSAVGVATEGFFRPVYIGNNKINFWVVKPDGTFQTSNPMVSLIVIGYYR